MITKLKYLKKNFINVISIMILSSTTFGCRSALTAMYGQKQKMVVTAYCACGKCCSWEYNNRGQTVYKSGKHKGKIKKVGVCADGSYVEHGTIAADLDLYPFGTRMYIPGYGYGVVHDCGSQIKSNHIDLYFEKHSDALHWGRKTIFVTIYPKRQQ